MTALPKLEPTIHVRRGGCSRSRILCVFLHVLFGQLETANECLLKMKEGHKIRSVAPSPFSNTQNQNHAPQVQNFLTNAHVFSRFVAIFVFSVLSCTSSVPKNKSEPYLMYDPERQLQQHENSEEHHVVRRNTLKDPASTGPALGIP